MRRIYLPILFLGLFISCNADQDFIDTVQAYNEDTSPQGEETGDSEDPDDPEVPDVDLPPIVDFEGQLEINTTPCEYTLEVLEANGNLAVDCTIDLDGQTIELPANVALEYTGGQIINGILNFTGGTIDGKLMNKDLTLTGDVALSSDVFQFHPERWDVVQGETSSEVAQNNNDILEGLMFYTKELGASTFVIDQFDAYFEVSKVTSTTTNQNFYPTLEAINVPSDYSLQMSENTILRVQPTKGYNSASLLAVDRAENVTIRGGILYGDRDLRIYDGENSEEGAHLLTIRSGKNILLDGIKFINGTHGGLNVNSYGFSFNPDYDPTSGVGVSNCIFEKNRMMSIAITDARNMLIENNIFIDSSQPTQYSDGGVVGYAINMEPVRTRDSGTGELIQYQIVKDIIIRNNTESNSRLGAVIIYIGDNVIVESNNLESKVAWTFAANCKIRGNTFIASENSSTTAAISAGGEGETTFNNEISSNIINGYGTGINANHRDIAIFNNQINNCRTGIQFKEAFDMNVYQNTINSTWQGSRGIQGHIAEINNVKIYQNEIETDSDPFYFVQTNRAVGSEYYSIDIYDNLVTNSSKTTISNTQGIIFHGNASSGGIQILNSEKIDITNNDISTNISHGINLLNQNYDILISGNQIVNPAGSLDCINIASSTNPNEVIQENNSCN